MKTPHPIVNVGTGQQYRVIYTAHNDLWARDIIEQSVRQAMNQLNDYKRMWTKNELELAMVKDGWEPGTVDGIFVHRRTGRHIDINARDDRGYVWLRYAGARQTPPPF